MAFAQSRLCHSSEGLSDILKLTSLRQPEKRFRTSLASPGETSKNKSHKITLKMFTCYFQSKTIQHFEAQGQIRDFHGEEDTVFVHEYELNSQSDPETSSHLTVYLAKLYIRYPENMHIIQWPHERF